jgi:cysteine-rich repeat protein
MRPVRFAPCLAAVLLWACGATGGGPAAAPGPAPTPAPAVCGDSQVQGVEECDDGNASNDDACLTSCTKPASFVSGDIHLHSAGCNDEIVSPGELAALTATEGIRVGSILIWGEGYERERSLFTGRDFPGSTREHLLHYDLEVSHFEAARGGHLIALGLRSLDFSPPVFDTPTGMPVADWARAQGAVVGMAHAQFWPEQGFPRPPGGCCMPWELPIEVARGSLDFLAVEKPGKYPVDGGAFRVWKSLLNSGFRVPLAAGSDYTCLNHGFASRTPHTDVLLDDPLTYKGFIDALRQGRSTVSLGRGHRLDLRVNGARMGDERRLRPGPHVEVVVETRFEAPDPVEVLVNGKVEGSFAAASGHQLGRVSLGLGRSAWIAARSRSVATSPVYVLVDDREIRASADDACYLVRYVRELSFMRGHPAAYGNAEDELLRRFHEAGGDVCS